MRTGENFCSPHDQYVGKCMSEDLSRLVPSEVTETDMLQWLSRA